MLRRVSLILAVSLALIVVTTLGTRERRDEPTVGINTVAAADVQVSNDQFARYVDEWSEAEGAFDSDNFISNETSYLHIIDQLHKRVRPGGVYLGVGPDQNFTYIAQTQPSLAIILDIRRQNMIEHLLYKALFELSSSRAEFLGRLFSRTTPNVDVKADLPAVLRAVRLSPSPDGLYQKNLDAIKNLLISRHDLELTEGDLLRLDYVYRTFTREGPDLRFSSIGRGNASQYPTYETLMLETDTNGKLQNYLATDELFQWMKRFETENRLVPIVADFAGAQAFKTVTNFLRKSGLQVSTFYTSNVEFYLFGQPEWDAYMNNVRTIPATPDAVFIRAYFPTYGLTHPLNVPGHRSTTLVHEFAPFVADYIGRRITTYWDVVNR